MFYTLVTNCSRDNLQIIVKSQWGMIKLPLLNNIKEIIGVWLENDKLMMLTGRMNLDLYAVEHKMIKADQWVVNVKTGKLLHLESFYIGLQELKDYAPENYHYILNQKKLQSTTPKQICYATEWFDLYIHLIYIYQNMQILYLYLSNEYKSDNPSVPLIEIPCSMVLGIEHDITMKTVQEKIFKKLEYHWKL